MGKGKNSNTRLYALAIVFVIVALAFLVFIAFTRFDLGHKIQILGYRRVSSYEELVAISENPFGKYRLTKDIDLQGKEWVPFTFSGVLDGDGHEITNMSVSSVGGSIRDTYDGNSKIYSTKFAGMFDVLENATVRNLNFSSLRINIESDEPCFIGTVAGYTSNSTISNCEIKADARLFAHDRSFGVGGVIGFGNGTLENLTVDVTLVSVDTDSLTKDEQFMGGIAGAGYPIVRNCIITIDGYDSEHGYVHNGGIIGMYKLPDGVNLPGEITCNEINGKITFFEDNDDRRAYCSSTIGEKMNTVENQVDNYSSFQGIEVYNYDVILLPEERSVSLDYDANESGYFDVTADYENNGADATYGLFVNDRFVKKVNCGAGSGTINETVFLDEGTNQIKFKFLPGDGDILIDNIEAAKSDKSVVLIIAPHEDDEVLGFAGTIQKTIAEGNIVKVLFLTNGDYFSEDFITIRYAESASALEILGVNRTDIQFLGYGDATLLTLITTEDQDKIYRGAGDHIATNGVHEQNFYDYHLLNYGTSAYYTGNNLRNDLRDYILAIRPESVYTTSEFENHPDHQSSLILTRDILSSLSGEIGYHPVLCSTVIHGEDDSSWPEALKYDSDGSIIYENFTNPFPAQAMGLSWDDTVKIYLTEEELEKKELAIAEFVSQNETCEYYEGTCDYNFAFCKSDEFYWIIDY